MKIATRTGIAAVAAAIAAIVVVTIVSTVLFRLSLRARVDDQLVERSERAAILAAVGERVSVSELNETIDGARISVDGRTIEVGRLPEEGLPPIEGSGWRTVDADGEEWRLYAVTVSDVPAIGDVAIVEFVEPLGDVDERVRTLRRRTLTVAAVAAIGVGALGWLWGRRAARPLTDLATDASRIGAGPPDTWRVRSDSGTPEVDELAKALNANLDRLAEQTARTEEALQSARSFAAGASHELRTPLQSAMTNLDVALAAQPDQPEVTRARRELTRAAAALSAVRALSEVDLIGPDDFDDIDLAELADQAVAAVGARLGSVTIAGPDQLVARVWADGVRLAIENVLRNIAVHARSDDDSQHRPQVAITLESPATVIVDDDGPGIPDADRTRMLRRFERGSSDRDGSGLGLAFVDRVVAAHGGTVDLSDSPLGGLRVTLRLVPTSR